MKRTLLILTGLFLFGFSQAQRLSQVTLSSGSADIITFTTEDGVIINISKEGQVIDWGIDGSQGRYYNSPGRLDKYMGRVEYYTANDNKDYQGKVKYVGRTSFTYYSSYENDLFKGKLKAMGSNNFDYYNTYDDELLRGKIKNAGMASFGYYSSFENEAYRGKFKNIGNTALSYYGSFEDKAFRGKIKNIGSHGFTYYSSFDRPGYQGAMKTGYQQEYVIDGLRYLLR